MKTIGQYLRDARQQSGITLERIEEKTKIKRAFILSLESEEWDKLPEFPVVLGFVGNISDTLNIDKKQITALLRRDYPPKKLDINPKPDISDKFTWNPKLTFFVGLSVVVAIFVTYLIIQYINFSSPPKLVVESPKEGEVLKTQLVGVNGKTEQDTKVSVNDQPVLIDEFGNFYTEIQVNGDTKKIEIKAKSRSGKESVIVRNVEVKLE